MSYYGRDLTEDPHGAFVERDADAAELSVDQGYYHAADTVTLSRQRRSRRTPTITITISDPEEHFATRTLTAQLRRARRLRRELRRRSRTATSTRTSSRRATATARRSASYQVVRDDDPTVDPPTGDVLRTYRLALITDPGYATFFGGPANVTAAKVTLINRVDQVYEDDLSIRMVLVANNDLLNLDTWAQAIGPNGPCGAAACFTQSQVTGCSQHDPRPVRDRADHRRVELRHRPPRARPAGRRRRQPRRRRPLEQGRRLHRHPDAGRRLLRRSTTWRTRWATSSAATTPSTATSSTAPAATATPPPRSSPAAAPRSWPTRASASRTTSSRTATRTSRSAASRRSRPTPRANQAAINEVQTASLRHFGGGNEVQVVTFGPGYSQAATIQPLSLAINAAPSATSLGGAEENGNTVTIATGQPRTRSRSATRSRSPASAVAGYNGTFTVTAVPTSRSFQYTNPTPGLATSGGGTVTLAAPGATESGTTVTISTAAAHGRSVGDVVTIAGVGVAGYNGTFTITAVPTPRTLPVHGRRVRPRQLGRRHGDVLLAVPGPDRRQRLGRDRRQRPRLHEREHPDRRSTRSPGFAGTVTVTGAASTGFTVTYGGASAGLDVPNIELVNLSCGGCFASVEETNHGGANDSFTLNYNGNVSAPITNGTNYTAAGILAALTPILPPARRRRSPASAAATFNNTGFQVTFTGTPGRDNVPVMLALQDFSAGASGFVGETDKGGAVDNKGGIITPTGDAIPVVTAPAAYTIPLRTPFALTGSATDADGDALLYSWEQNDRGGAAGTSLLNNTKTNGPLFAMFPKSGQISLSDTLHVQLAGREPPHHRPDARVPGPPADPGQQHERRHGRVPDRADRAAGAAARSRSASRSSSRPPTTSASRASTRARSRSTSASPPATARAASTAPTRRCSSRPARARSSSPRRTRRSTYTGGSTQTVTWNVAGTDAAPISAANVKISLSTDGGLTYPVRPRGEHAERRLRGGDAARTSARRRRGSRSRRSATSSSTSRTPTSRSRAVPGRDELARRRQQRPCSTATRSRRRDGLGHRRRLGRLEPHARRPPGLPAGLSLSVTSTSADGDARPAPAPGRSPGTHGGAGHLPGHGHRDGRAGGNRDDVVHDRRDEGAADRDRGRQVAAVRRGGPADDGDALGLRSRPDARDLGCHRHGRVHHHGDALQPAGPLPDHLHGRHLGLDELQLRHVRSRHARRHDDRRMRDRHQERAAGGVRRPGGLRGSGRKAERAGHRESGWRALRQGGSITGPLRVSGATVVRLCGVTATGPLSVATRAPVSCSSAATRQPARAPGTRSPALWR